MPGDRNLTIVYAGAASLAAITLVYVFSPSFAIDSHNTSFSQRQKGVVGLVNTGNDCFINSTLQALAGLPELREYLIHRGRIAKESGEFSKKSFLSGALKDILDKLNEKPIRRKVISARSFLTVLEAIFNQRISRAQQDAHEFLQIVAEKLAEEYYAMEKFKKERERKIEAEEASGSVQQLNGFQEKLESDLVGEYGMPLEGTLESEIECMKCHFKTKPVQSKFMVMTLSVPLKTSATLNDCIDGAFTTEYIDDFQCDKCRLQHAISHYEAKLSTCKPREREVIQDSISRLQQALDNDPQSPPASVPLPPSSPAIRSRIAKRTCMSTYPAVFVIHLSRSIYEHSLASRKNVCKVSFPEYLSMGGFMDRRGYKLQCVVTHKGGHESGHYECFRRHNVWPAPFSTPHQPSPGGTIPGTPAISVTPSGSAAPLIKETCEARNSISESNCSVSPITPISPSLSVPTQVGDDRPSSPASIRTVTSATPTGLEPPSPSSSSPTPSKVDCERKKKKVKKNNKWWRISDEKIKEAKTDDVLSQQKEVYLLFYERMREDR
ncbi:hypothetical protein BGX38DRAFT_1198406 [Terfezia claveryi]|nr:hypothetical protein BGX38DRAFT_1198406 [Terfezia claveryi]